MLTIWQMNGKLAICIFRFCWSKEEWKTEWVDMFHPQLITNDINYYESIVFDVHCNIWINHRWFGVWIVSTLNQNVFIVGDILCDFDEMIREYFMGKMFIEGITLLFVYYLYCVATATCIMNYYDRFPILSIFQTNKSQII